MAPKGHGVGYRKSNSLRKAPGEEDSPITIGRRVLSGREDERERFWMSFMVGASSVRQRLRGSSVWFSVDWSCSAERSEPKQHTVIVPCVAVQ